MIVFVLFGVMSYYFIPYMLLKLVVYIYIYIYFIKLMLLMFSYSLKYYDNFMSFVILMRRPHLDNTIFFYVSQTCHTIERIQYVQMGKRVRLCGWERMIY